MRHRIFASLVVLLISAGAYGTTIPTCSTVTDLEAAIGLPSGCTISDKTFANFGLNVLGNTLTATGVATSFTKIGSKEFLTLTGAFSAVGGLPAVDVITYTVQATGNTIEDLGVDITNGNPLGEVTVDEFACVAAQAGISFTTDVNGVPTGCSAGNFSLFTADALTPIAGVTFSPSAFVLVEKRIELGATTGVGSLSSLTNEVSQVSQVPEPATLSLVVTGLLGIAMRLRRRR